jgi:hypothetical protein
MKKNPKDSRIELLTKVTNMIMLNPIKKTKTKRKNPSPTLGGTIDHFGKIFQRQKVRKQALVIFSLEIPKTPFEPANILFLHNQ